MVQLYDELSQYYDAIAARLVDTETEVEFVDRLLSNYAASTLLDIGCGTGRHSAALARKGYKVTGVDESLKLLTEARKKVVGDNPEFICSNVADMTFNKKFDAAICMWSTFGELPYHAMLERLHGALNPKGLFLVDSRYITPEQTTKTITKESLILLDNGKNITAKLTDDFADKKRVRKVEYKIDGKIIRDVSIMDILTESDFIHVLNQHGFRHIGTWYDYRHSTATEEPHRFQLLFEKS